jgi:hypothetical protein
MRSAPPLNLCLQDVKLALTVDSACYISLWTADACVDAIARIQENGGVHVVCVYYCSTYYKAVRVVSEGA